jgi:hypothetical protein
MGLQIYILFIWLTIFIGSCGSSEEGTGDMDVHGGDGDSDSDGDIC